MADYAKSTNFTALRGSTPADPAVFDTEFTAVANASATKLDKTGGTLTGPLTGTSASFPGGVTANLTGNVTGNVTGNASTATTASACSGNSATATYATSAGTAVDATARSAASAAQATASAAVPKDVGVYGVGTIALMILPVGLSVSVASGSTIAGTSLRTYGISASDTPSGTWRNITNSTISSSSTVYGVGLFQRIA